MRITDWRAVHAVTAGSVAEARRPRPKLHYGFEVVVVPADISSTPAEGLSKFQSAESSWVFYRRLYYTLYRIALSPMC